MRARNRIAVSRADQVTRATLEVVDNHVKVQDQHNEHLLAVQSRCSYERARCIAQQGKIEIGLSQRRIGTSLQATGQASHG